MTTNCDNCEARATCPFYEAGSDECVYEVLAAMAGFKG